MGIGISLGAHLTPLARDAITKADIVFVAASDPIVEKWVESLNPCVCSLQPYYATGKSRMKSYREMLRAIMDVLRRDLRVCGAFYGHPGVFAWVPHRAVSRAREEGYEAIMIPGISAEDCLYADMGIDPGRYGCQHYEASQFMLYDRQFDPSAYLILWQVGLAGDRSLTRFSTGPAERQILTETLLRSYSVDHGVFLYEAASLPLAPPRVAEIRLDELPRAETNQNTTLVIPPGRKMTPNRLLQERLDQLDVKSSVLS